MTTIFLWHSLHPKHLHLTEMLMFGDGQCLGQDICHHAIGSNEFQVNAAVLNAFLNKMISDVNVLHSSMIHGVPGKEVHSTIVNKHLHWSRHTFTKLRE